MSVDRITLRYLAFAGHQKENARLDFGPGLNVIFGASETGKSFVLESLDFMLGGGRALRDIPERVGYDRVLLGMEGRDGRRFTVGRAAAGGQFSLFDGFRGENPEGTIPQILLARHNATKEDNISTFLLSQIGLSGRRIRRDRHGNTNDFSFRNLAHLCLISEAEIQKRESPIEGTTVYARTPEIATFKLLLSGADDSAVQASGDRPTERLSRAAREEVIGELIGDYRKRLHALIGERGERGELVEQLALLDDVTRAESEALKRSEADYRALTDRRGEFRRTLESARDRRGEIDGLLTRFALLGAHYESDLERLEGLREAGSLVSALSPQTCPLCGAAPAHQHSEEECDGNIDAIVEAADAESKKIRVLSSELGESVEHLGREALIVDNELTELESEIKRLQGQIDDVSPSVANRRRSYTELVENRTVIQSAIGILDRITELEERRDASGDTRENRSAADLISSELSTHTLNEFCQLYEEILKSWGVPEADRVYFDSDSRDVVISGKLRGSRGKGMRAITHAAFSICLMEFALGRELPHAGFVVLDSPLLAYREPEGDEDDLTGTDVQERFYEYLGTRCHGQTIVLENLDPPYSVRDAPQSVMFSKNPQIDRYGFFPHSSA